MVRLSGTSTDIILEKKSTPYERKIRFCKKLKGSENKEFGIGICTSTFKGRILIEIEREEGGKRGKYVHGYTINPNIKSKPVPLEKYLNGPNTPSARDGTQLLCQPVPDYTSSTTDTFNEIWNWLAGIRPGIELSGSEYKQCAGSCVSGSRPFKRVLYVDPVSNKKTISYCSSNRRDYFITAYKVWIMPDTNGTDNVVDIIKFGGGPLSYNNKTIDCSKLNHETIASITEENNTFAAGMNAVGGGKTVFKSIRRLFC
jgi:hypothetical protein